MDRSCEDVRVIADMKETKERCEARREGLQGVSPLTHERRYDEEDIAQLTADGEISELSVVAEGEDRTTWFVWLLVACTSISGLLFGESRSFMSLREYTDSLLRQDMTPA